MDPTAQHRGKPGEKSTRQPLLKAVEEVLPQYVARMQLGAGSFGRVFLMEHKTTGERVAVKTLKKERIVELGMQDKVLREIRILLRLRHPHVIRLHNVIETSKYILLVMEYAENGELFDYITQRGRLTEGEARRIFQQLVGAVEFCHSRMVVHRDLKPENILLDSLWRVKLADFGLGNCMKEGHFLRTSCGSPNYAAPEVISGRLYSGPEVDVWGCGVVLFTLLCGRLPFDEKSHVALYQKIKAGAYSRPTHVTPAVQDLLARMLVVDPLQRISIPEIRQHPWFLPWFLPTQLLQYQKEEEQRRQLGPAADDLPRTTVQVNASSIANLHAVKIPQSVQRTTLLQGTHSLGPATLSLSPEEEVALEQASPAEREPEVACLSETGKALPWLEDGTLRQRVKGKLHWLPGVPVSAKQVPPHVPSGFSLWQGYTAPGPGAASTGQMAAGGRGGWEAMASVCIALQRVGAKWKKLGPYTLSCRSSPIQCRQPVSFAAAAGLDSALAAKMEQQQAYGLKKGSSMEGIAGYGGGAPYGHLNGTISGGMMRMGPSGLGYPHASVPAMLPQGYGAGGSGADVMSLMTQHAHTQALQQGVLGVEPDSISHTEDKTVRRGSLALGTLAAAAAAAGGGGSPLLLDLNLPQRSPMQYLTCSSLSGIDQLAAAAALSSACSSVQPSGVATAALLGLPQVFYFMVQFELQLYLEPGSKSCWVDLRLKRGCPSAFMDFSSRFWEALAQCLEEREREAQARRDAENAASLSLVWH